jgi:amidase
LVMKELTLKAQGELCYTISASNTPRLRVDSGDIVRVETEDAFSGQIRKEGDRRDVTQKPYPNPQSGPIYVNNAVRGDTLAVRIEDIQPLIGQGATRIVSFWYNQRDDTELFLRFLDASANVPHGSRICPIRDGKVYFDEFVLPYRPMIGTMAAAHPAETYLPLFPGPHGGNMDIKEVTTGATLYLPVLVDGALLHMGDVHAIQGEGELSGAAVEMPSRTTLKIDLIKHHAIDWPRIESQDALYSVAATETGRTLEDALRVGFVNLALWLEGDYGINRWDAFELLTLVSKVSLGNLWTVAVGVPKQFLPEKNPNKKEKN